jgi:hypothetical protein
MQLVLFSALQQLASALSSDPRTGYPYSPRHHGRMVALVARPIRVGLQMNHAKTQSKRSPCHSIRCFVTRANQKKGVSSSKEQAQTGIPA